MGDARRRAQRRMLARMTGEKFEPEAPKANVGLVETIELDVPKPLMRRLRKLKAELEKQHRMPAAPMRVLAGALLESSIDREEMALAQAAQADSIIIQPTPQEMGKALRVVPA